MFKLDKYININYTDYKYINKFKEKSLSERKKISQIIKDKYLNRIPIIIDTKEKIIIDKNKYIVPIDLTVGQFIFIIRKKLKINQNQAIFITCNNKLMCSSMNINDIYNKEISDDEFLYFIICIEETFG